jgi:hypothetical protein
MADLPITSDNGATPVVLNDPTTTANVANVKAASTASVVGDNSLVVALSPNSPVPTGTNNIGITGVAQGSTTSGEHGDLVQGAVTTASPTYTTGQTSPLSLDVSGNLRVRPTSDSDNNVTGTITALNGTVVINTQGMASLVFTLTGTWVATIGFQGFDGTNWITASGLTIPAGGITEALSANGSVLLNCGGFSEVRLIATAFTSGTVNVFMNAGAGTSLVEVYNDSQNPLVVGVAQASTTSGEIGPLMQGAVTTTVPTYITGQTDPLSLMTDGALRVRSTDFSGSGTVTAVNQSIVANTIGCSSVSFLLSGTYSGSFLFYASLDNISYFQIFDGPATASGVFTIPCGGYLSVKVESFTFTSGTATVVWYSSLGVNTVQVWQENPFNLNANVSQSTASNLLAEVNGAVTTDYPTYTTATVEPLSLSTVGALRSEQFVSSANVYSVGTGAFTPPATPTDVAIITGSATHTVYVTRIELSTTQTAAGVNNWFMIKRSTANTGGTSATPTLVPLDSNNPAATAVVRSYTANPTTLGTSVGNVRVTKVLSDSPTTAFPPPYVFDFTNSGLCSGVVLRGVAQSLCLNFNGVALPGGLNVTVNFEWVEL